ncbi:MAG: FAD-binding oxidoreductase, partial [Candidatus Dadabacteria bacterium]
MRNKDFKRKLESLFGKKAVFSEDILAYYNRDSSAKEKLFKSKPLAVVYPEEIAEVVELVKLALSYNQPLVPSGGRTGTVCGAVDVKGKEVIVSFEKMNKIIEINTAEKTVKAQAGVVLQRLQEEVLKYNLFFPIDIASKGSCQVGGIISTNAGGIHVLRWGLTRDWTASLTVVTGKAEVLTTGKVLRKDRSGYDLKELFIGAEGTLGFIVEAVFWLTDLPPPLLTIAFSVKDAKAILAVKNFLEKKVYNPFFYFEFFDNLCYEKVLNHTSLNRPFSSSWPYYCVIQVEEEKEDLFVKYFSYLMQQGIVADCIFAQSTKQAGDLCQLRERIGEVLTRHYAPQKYDVAVPPSKIPLLIGEIKQVAKNSSMPPITVFGHIADGNLHLNMLLKESSINATDKELDKWDKEIYKIVLK